MKKSPAGLEELQEEDPKKFVSLVRLAWPRIRAALDRGHSVKVINERFVKGGARISYRLFAMYVGQLRETPPMGSEPPRFFSGITERTREQSVPLALATDQDVALVRVRKRRLFTARAAAQYLGIHQQTLKKMTERGELPARKMGQRSIYCLEDLDRYIESLPLSA